MKVPLAVPNIGKEEERAVKEVLKSKWLIHGPKNKEFEEQFTKLLGVKHAITVNSCTSALFLAVKALGIKGEIILPSYTFSASANAIETAGATPVFVDIDEKTLNIDPKKIEKEITKKTRAIMSVHIAGLVCDMGPIMKLAKKYKLRVIEDSAETLGGTYGKKQAGGFDIGCFSFFPTKNITTGEGGMFTTNDSDLARKVRAMAAHGFTKDTHKRLKKEGQRNAIFAGYNFRMSNILAAIGVEQMKKLKKTNVLRRKHADYLNKNLSNLPIDLPYEPKGFKHVYQMYIIKVSKNRDKLLEHLKNKGVGATVFSDPPVHKQVYYYKKYGKEYKGLLAVTKKVSDSNIVLPLYPQMNKTELNYVIKVMKEFFKLK